VLDFDCVKLDVKHKVSEISVLHQASFCFSIDLFVVNADVVTTCNQTMTTLLYVAVDFNMAGSKNLQLMLII